MENKTLEDRLNKLFARPMHVVKLGLDTIQAILERLDAPEKTLTCLHVAGTNGKGSVCAMLDSMLRAAGYRTGLYTSPHLVRFNERISVGGNFIADEDLAELFNRVDEADRAAAAQPGGRPATFFEFTTALAFEYFRSQETQIAVIETGLGGRLDATNVVDPLVSVITPLSLEHTAYLGDTLEKIAAEKAGIIKPGRPVVCAGQPDEALAVLRARAEEVGAPFFRVGDQVSIRRLKQDARGQKLKIETSEFALKPLVLPLLGEFQIENCAIAVTVLQALAGVSAFVCDSAAMKKGLEQVVWPGRCQALSAAPPVVLDVAHNPAGAQALVGMLDGLWADRPIALVAGLLSDKDARGFFHAFGRRVKWCRLVELPGERNMPPDLLMSAARAEGLPAEPAVLDRALADARAWAARENGVVCIAGSLVLAGCVLSALPAAK